MSLSERRFFDNALQPITIDEPSLKKALKDLHASLFTSVNILLRHVRQDEIKDSIYVGTAGIALAFLRLVAQYEKAGLQDHTEDFSAIRQQIPGIISTLLVGSRMVEPPGGTLVKIEPGRTSPLHSPVGLALVRILATLTLTTLPESEGSINTEGKAFAGSETGSLGVGAFWKQDIDTLRQAVRVALSEKELGGDELLYGRAGLLWALLNLRKRVLLAEDTGCPFELSDARRADLIGILSITAHANDDAQTGKEESSRAIAEIADAIVKAGLAGAEIYQKSTGDKGLPLMWPWHGSFYLGAVHGVAGILTVLLQVPPDILSPNATVSILATVKALCQLSQQHKGNIPTSLPSGYNLVQICHGAPGLMPLLATVRLLQAEVSSTSSETNELLVCCGRTAREATDVIWREGLVKKGLSICHGVSGSGWALLTMAAATGQSVSDELLGYALAFLLHARELPPCSMGPSSLIRTGVDGTAFLEHKYQYGTPDRPYSLFEGLSGAICAWLDACIIIKAKLTELQLEDQGRRPRAETTKTGAYAGFFGIPGLGGLGPHGVF